MSEEDSYMVQFPPVPYNLKAKYSTSDLSLRPFGAFQDDLNIDFNQRLRPYLVTQILQCCTGHKNGDMFDQTFFWELTIGKRIECLLTITALANTLELPIQLRCLNEACQKQMEIEISLEELANLKNRSDDNDYFMVQFDSERLQMRKPTGNDQLEWLKSTFPNEDAAIKAMIHTLISYNAKSASNEEYAISDEWVKTINETFTEIDPLVNFSLITYCPYCDKQGCYELNLEELLLQELYKAQLSLMDTIHLLARHYHWSERQILSIPPWRRQHYLAMIEKEET